MSKFKIRHLTRYLYEGPVRDSANQIMLYPLLDEYQDVLKHDIRISGDPVVSQHKDYFGNEVGTFMHSQPHFELIIDSRLEVSTKPRKLPDPSTVGGEQWAGLRQLKSQPEFMDFLKVEYFNALPEIRALVGEMLKVSTSPLALVNEFSSYVFTTFTYKKGITSIESTLDEIWSLKSGVCQDFAQILLVMLRQAQIPARYVSGYVCPNESGMRGEGATHAWVDAYIPDYGWLGIDPTNNLVVNDAHVRLAVGKNFSDCSPVKGTYRGTSEHVLEVEVSVSYEDGRIKSTSEAARPDPEPVTSFSRNSYRRHQEMQQQQ